MKKRIQNISQDVENTWTNVNTVWIIMVMKSTGFRPRLCKFKQKRKDNMDVHVAAEENMQMVLQGLLRFIGNITNYKFNAFVEYSADPDKYRCKNNESIQSSINSYQ